MMRSVIICPDRELGRHLQRALGEAGNIGVIRTIEQYPNAIELTRFVRSHAPQIAFLSVESLPQALATFSIMEDAAPGTQIVAISKEYDPRLLLEVMRAGIREFVALPF